MSLKETEQQETEQQETEQELTQSVADNNINAPTLSPSVNEPTLRWSTVWDKWERYKRAVGE